jgi:hypothetical protein
MTALCLWEFGEDQWVKPALDLTDRHLTKIQELAARYHDPSFALPDPGQAVSNGHVIAYAALTHFEGRLRPLARGRRRPSSQRPAYLLKSLAEE